MAFWDALGGDRWGSHGLSAGILHIWKCFCGYNLLNHNSIWYFEVNWWEIPWTFLRWFLHFLWLPTDGNVFLLTLQKSLLSIFLQYGLERMICGFPPSLWVRHLPLISPPKQLLFLESLCNKDMKSELNQLESCNCKTLVWRVLFRGDTACVIYNLIASWWLLRLECMKTAHRLLTIRSACLVLLVKKHILVSVGFQWDAFKVFYWRNFCFTLCKVSRVQINIFFLQQPRSSSHISR